jgi:hypothetical protein
MLKNIVLVGRLRVDETYLSNFAIKKWKTKNLAILLKGKTGQKLKARLMIPLKIIVER